MTGHRPLREGVYDTSNGTAAGRGTFSDTVAVQPGLYRRISWGAVLGGTLMVVAVQLLLSMLGLGLGLTTIDPAQGAAGTPEATTMGTTAAVWWAVSYLVALIVGGYVAARLAGAFEKTDGVLHGLLTWALALVVSFWLLTSAIGSVIGGAFNAVGNAVSGISSTVADAVPQVADASGLSAEQIQQRVQNLMRPADQTGQSPEAAQNELVSLVPRIVAGGQDAEQAQQRAIQIVSQQAGISEDEARARLLRVFHGRPVDLPPPGRTVLRPAPSGEPADAVAVGFAQRQVAAVDTQSRHMPCSVAVAWVAGHGTVESEMDPYRCPPSPERT